MHGIKMKKYALVLFILLKDCRECGVEAVVPCWAQVGFSCSGGSPKRQARRRYAADGWLNMNTSVLKDFIIVEKRILFLLWHCVSLNEWGELKTKWQNIFGYIFILLFFHFTLQGVYKITFIPDAVFSRLLCADAFMLNGYILKVPGIGIF